MLHDYVEIFACSYEDMPRLDTNILVHRLPTKEDCPPVKKKVRRMHSEMSEKIKAEVMKQFNARLLSLKLRMCHRKHLLINSNTVWLV